MENEILYDETARVGLLPKLLLTAFLLLVPGSMFFLVVGKAPSIIIELVVRAFLVIAVVASVWALFSMRMRFMVLPGKIVIRTKPWFMTFSRMPFEILFSDITSIKVADTPWYFLTNMNPQKGTIGRRLWAFGPVVAPLRRELAFLNGVSKPVVIIERSTGKFTKIMLGVKDPQKFIQAVKSNLRK